ncbi:MAG: hypothetical protein ACI9ZF_001088 [Bradyrhizobium sp.]|jgi:hypothetical protein
MQVSLQAVVVVIMKNLQHRIKSEGLLWIGSNKSSLLIEGTS